MPLDAQNHSQQSNLPLCNWGNLVLVEGMIIKLAGIDPAWGTEQATLNRLGVLDTIDVFALVLFMSPKWTRIKIAICVLGISKGLSPIYQMYMSSTRLEN